MAMPRKVTLRLRDYGFTPKPEKMVTVEFNEIPHYLGGNDWSRNRNGNPWRAYEVLHNGKVIGKVEQVTESTDRKSGRIRVPGKGRLAWAWTRKPYHIASNSNSPGLYARNRNDAVAELLGYQYGELPMDRR